MIDAESTNIVIIELNQSVMVRGIKNRLDELHFKVIELGNNLSEIKRYCGKVQLFVLYLSDSIIDNSESKSTVKAILKDVEMHRQKMVLVGEKDYLDDISKRMTGLKNFDRFNLPIEMSKLGKMIEDVLKTDGTADAKNILIVDDDPDYAKMVKSWINEDYTVNIVTNGMQTIKFISKKKVDLILLDYEMPVVDGAQVLEMLHSEAATKDIQVIMLTAKDDKESVMKVLELKPEKYLLKSMPPNMWVEEIDDFFRSKM